MFGRRRPRGEALLARVVAQFDSLIDDLEVAEAECDEDRRAVQSQMDLLRVREVALVAASARAKRVCEKLNTLTE